MKHGASSQRGPATKPGVEAASESSSKGTLQSGNDSQTSPHQKDVAVKAYKTKRRQTAVSNSERNEPGKVDNVFNNTRNKRRTKRATRLERTNGDAVSNSWAPQAVTNPSPIVSIEQQQQQQHPIGITSIHEKPRRSWLYSVIVDTKSQTLSAARYRKFVFVVTGMDVLSLILSTDQVNFGKRHHVVCFVCMETFASVCLTMEYIFRFILVPRGGKYRKLDPVSGRLRYLVSYSGVLDVLAVAPLVIQVWMVLRRLEVDLIEWSWPTAFASLLIPATSLNSSTLLQFAQFLRLLRWIRVLLQSHSSSGVALDAAYRVVYYNREVLWLAVQICLYIVLLSGILLYYLRPPESADDDFHSMAATLYLSTLLLTGQGGPTGSDLPWYTKVVVLLTSILSVAVFAIPASMITWGFEGEAARIAKRTRRRVQLKHEQNRQRPPAMPPPAASRESSIENSSGAVGESVANGSDDTDDGLSVDDVNDDGDTTDEEYLNVIANAESSTSSGDSSFERQVLATFSRGDVNGDGVLSSKEFVRLQMQIMSQNVASANSLMEPAPHSLEGLESRVATLEQLLRDQDAKLEAILNLLKHDRTGT
jgi:Ion transport protein